MKDREEDSLAGRIKILDRTEERWKTEERIT